MDNALLDEDESVRIAVSALDNMRNGAQPSRSDRLAVVPEPNSPFVSRMSHIPLVTSALRAYEQGKASSRVVKYGAEMMESSVKSISRPVIGRLPVNVNQLDEFACRQLDRLDRYRRSSSGEDIHHASASPDIPLSGTQMARDNPSSLLSPTASSSSSTSELQNTSPPNARTKVKLRAKTFESPAVDHSLGGTSGDASMEYEPEDQGERNESNGEGSRVADRSWPDTELEKRHSNVPSWLHATSPFVTPPPPPPSFGPASPKHLQTDSQPQPRPRHSVKPHEPQHSHSQRPPSESRHEHQIAQRSRWQAVLLEAGGLSAALSEESMRRLKYCLQWLLYATAHIDAQILILRDFIASLQPLLPAHPSSNPTTASSLTTTTTAPSNPPPISQAHLRTLTAVRRDIVRTIRQVVNIVSQYAGGALPEPARGRVRGFILELPGRWARRAGGQGAEDEEREREGGSERGGGNGERGMERESVAAAATGGSGSGALRRGNRRAAGHRERGSQTGSRAASPIAKAHGSRHGDQGGTAGENKERTATVAAQKILTLATESLDMMRGVTSVVKDSLDRADAWVGRFRTVGIQRGREEEHEEESASAASNNAEPEFELGHMHYHRRGESSGSHSYYNDGDSGMRSPLSGSSSYAGGSSIPSTPGGGTFTPAYTYAYGHGYVAGAAGVSEVKMGVETGGCGNDAPSPATVEMGAMSLGGSTPRSGILPLLGEEAEEASVGEKIGAVEGVRVVGTDVRSEDGEEESVGREEMNVDA